jgi:hypothetical protein
VDELQSMVSQSSQILIIEEDMIEKRADSINMKKSFLRRNLKVRLSLELESDLTTLMGIKSNYRRFLKDYPAEVFDNGKHKVRIDNLRKDVAAGKLSEKELDTIFSKEKNILTKHLNEVKATAKSIYLVENQYHRSSHTVNEAFEKLKAQCGIKADNMVDKDDEEVD